MRTSDGRSSTEVDRSSGRSSLHRYDACTSPGTNQTRWSAGPASRSRRGLLPVRRQVDRADVQVAGPGRQGRAGQHQRDDGRHRRARAAARPAPPGRDHAGGDQQRHPEHEHRADLVRGPERRRERHVLERPVQHPPERRRVGHREQPDHDRHGDQQQPEPEPAQRPADQQRAGDGQHRQRERREHDDRRRAGSRRTPAATTPRPPEPYSGHRPSPRSTSAADDGPEMPCGVSELSTTVAPAPRASTDGMTQYSETATTSTAQRPTTASARRHDPGRTTATTTGTATSWNSGTTPAFIPDVAANASANPAGHRQRAQRPAPSGTRSACTRQSSCQGSSAHGSRIACVVPATTTYGLATNTVPATSGPSAGAAGDSGDPGATRCPVAARGRAGPRPSEPTASRSSRSTRTDSSGGIPDRLDQPDRRRDRRQPDVEATGSRAAGSACQADRYAAALRHGAR